MSAIFGLVNLDGRPAVKRELDLMAVALEPHGRDAVSSWTGDHIGLGHRLMCFTPEDRLERQPLASPEGACVLVADGRIDNRPELRSELGIQPGEANAIPDSAFVLQAYQKWGLDCCSHLVGDLVFALSDSHDGHVLIARLPMSRRSLYYHGSAGIFAFASAPKGLFALPWIRREIDQQRLADYLVWAPREQGRSFFSGVDELEAGWAIVVRRERFTLHRYWNPDPLRETRFPDNSDYLEAFNALFDRVIADNMRSLTPVGVMMSGGLDSSSVAATAARRLSPRQGTRLAAFTEVPRAGFDAAPSQNRYADETPFVEAIARECGNLDLNLVRTDGCFLLDGISQFFCALDGPFRSPWNRAWWEAILRQAGARNLRVLLTGLMGNFTISREGEGVLPQLIRQGKWLRAVRQAQSCASQNRETSTLRVLARGAARLLPTPLWRAAGGLLRPNSPRFRASPGWRAWSPIHPEFARLHRVNERAREKEHDFYEHARYRTPAQRYELLRRYDSGTYVDRGYEALLGVQCRHPAADVRIVEFCMSLPEEQFQLDGVPRSLIRRAMKDRLPTEVLTNQRRGSQAADWFEHAVVGRLRFLDELALIERSELATAALDLNLVREAVRQIPAAGPGISTMVNVQAILGTAFMAGSFIRWVESS